MFYVGQKVVCVDATGSRQLLRQGDVYTVSKLGVLTDGTPGLDVAEETEPCGHDVGWRRSRFRPVVEREYDISIFTEILNGKRIHLPDLVETEARSSLADMFVGTVGVLAGGLGICWAVMLAEFWGMV